jgi:CheY-like chemotaxis protein
MNQVSILIADDDAGIRLMLRTALETDGYAISEAANGRDALIALRRQPFDLALLDLNMPVLDGMAVLEGLRTTPTKTRVIVLTAYGSIQSAVKATRLGAVDFLEKPITPVEIRQAIKSVWEESLLDAPPVVSDRANVYDDALERVRGSLRMANLDTAESLLTRVAESREKQTAEYFNLLGVLYEAQSKWRLARKCYGKAIASNKDFVPAQSNMRRLYELQTFGKSAEPVLLGDESAYLKLLLPPHNPQASNRAHPG